MTLYGVDKQIVVNKYIGLLQPDIHYFEQPTLSAIQIQWVAKSCELVNM